MKRLLILTTNFPPSRSIGTQRILRICKYLDRSAWKISVLTQKEKYYPEHPSTQPLPPYLDDVSISRTGKFDLVFFLLNLRASLFKKPVSPAEKTAVRKPENGSAVNGSVNGKAAEPASPKKGYRPAEKLARRSTWQIIKDIFTDLFQFPDKNITWLPLALWRGYRIIKKQKIDVVCFSSSPPHSLHLMSALLKKLTGARLVIDFRDPWARSPWHDEERDANTFEKWKHDKIVSYERWVIEQADRVILITREMRDDFVRFYADLPAEKFQLFNNGFDPDNLAEFSKSESKPAARDTIRFIHAGSLYKHRDPTPILVALKNLLDQKRLSRDAVEFVFLGAVTDHQKHTKSLAETMGLGEAVQFISRVSYQKSLEYMAASDVLILLQPVTRLQLPGKFYDYICWDKPILAVAEKDSATRNIVVDQFGIFVDFNDVADIEKGIMFLYERPDYLVKEIRKNREMYNMEHSIHRFDAILTVQ